MLKENLSCKLSKESFYYVQINGHHQITNIILYVQEVGKMKRKLIYNYWLITIAWCMFLNDCVVLSILLGLLGCAILVFMKRRINYWRMSFISVISYITIYLILSMSNIAFYFNSIYIFLAIICLDLSLTVERLCLLKIKYIQPFLVIMLTGMTVLSIITCILPSDLYILFTKSSLFIMIGIIFLPHIVSVSICIAYKELIRYLENRIYTKTLRIQRQH